MFWKLCTRGSNALADSIALVADILWSGTPILTYPRYLHKMCSRVATSIALATGFGEEMIVSSAEEYETRALAYCTGHSYEYVPARAGAGPTEIDGRRQRRGRGALSDLRRKLFLTREQSPLFDTKRWTRNMEKVSNAASISPLFALLLKFFMSYRAFLRLGLLGSKERNSRTHLSGEVSICCVLLRGHC